MPEGENIPQGQREESSTPDALDLWAIQDGLLQSYRSIFITTESILFAIATFLRPNFGEPGVLGDLILLLLIALGVGTVGLWFRICDHRADAVTFAQLLVRAEENGLGITKRMLSDFKGWQRLDRGEQKLALKRILQKVEVEEAVPRESVLERILEGVSEKKSSEPAFHETRFYLNKALPGAFLTLWILLLFDLVI